MSNCRCIFHHRISRTGSGLYTFWLVVIIVRIPAPAQAICMSVCSNPVIFSHRKSLLRSNHSAEVSDTPCTTGSCTMSYRTCSCSSCICHHCGSNTCSAFCLFPYISLLFQLWICIEVPILPDQLIYLPSSFSNPKSRPAPLTRLNIRGTPQTQRQTATSRSRDQPYCAS